VSTRPRHFRPRGHALDIEGLGSPTSKAYFRVELVQSPADIFRLDQGKQLLARERLGGDLRCQPDRRDRRQANPPLDRFLFALGIRHVGEVTARDLARRYRSWAGLRAAIEAALEVRRGIVPALGEEERKHGQRRDKAVVAAIETPGIGPEVANALLDFFEEPHNREVLDALEAAGVKPADVVWEIKQSPVTGKTLVFTGSLETLSRDEAKAQAEKLGAKVAGSVSAEDGYGDRRPGAGSKLKKAQDLGVQVLTEEESGTPCRRAA
jgi:DNA ligase (NAD+)